MQNLRPSNIKVIFQRPSCRSPTAVASGFTADTAPVVCPSLHLGVGRVVGYARCCDSGPLSPSLRFHSDSVESSDTETGVRELCQHGRTDRDAVSDTNWATAQGTMNCVGAWSPWIPREKKQSWGHLSDLL